LHKAIVRLASMSPLNVIANSNMRLSPRRVVVSVNVAVIIN
jgi:hypothetical protein